MTNIKLIDLVNRDVKGMKADIIRQGGKYHYDYQDIPKIRTLESVKVKTIKGETWIYWYWTPEHENGIYDCGYSGVADSELHRINDVYIRVEA